MFVMLDSFLSQHVSAYGILLTLRTEADGFRDPKLERSAASKVLNSVREQLSLVARSWKIVPACFVPSIED